jgi:hypothetical protein
MAVSAPRTILALIAALAVAAPAAAQIQLPGKKRPAGEPPADLTPYEAEVWPFPAPDPKTWWDDKWPKAPEAADPLGGRRIGRGERLPDLANGIDASTYRLWGLMPLQWQLLRGDEMVLEVWVRPSRNVRQSVMRVTVRRDGDAFVQARAGYACCEAGIGRRLGFDAKLPEGSAAKFLALRNHPMWQSPRDVRVAESGAAEGLCVDGAAYDITLLTAAGARLLRRACDPAQEGQVADVLEAVIGATVGHDPRFDILYPGGPSFAASRAAYRDLVQSGGSLKADPNNRRQPPGAEPAPPPEAAPPA